MENKYKIVLSYIQDLSVEIPSPETLITIRNTIPEYQMKVDIKSKPLKKKMIERTKRICFLIGSELGLDVSIKKSHQITRCL